MASRVAIALLACFFLSTNSWAQNKPASVNDPKLTDADFAAQGEYVGEHPSENGPTKAGVQIIALGNGKFRAVLYNGGLPGDGWDKGERKSFDGQIEDGHPTFKAGDGKGILKDGVVYAYNANGQEVAQFKRVERASPTLNARPPEGAVVLFDGSSAAAFKGGKIEDGLLVAGATSNQAFQDFKLHLEFRTPFMPMASGQARGNSGCYLQGRYEVQILDSFGLEGKNNECGGIYEIRDPDLNMCFPPMSWQTYNIDYTAARYDATGKKTANARITVRHNGVLIHENVELPRATRAAPVKEGPEAGPVYLQDHGNPVRFRNIWLVEKK